MEGTMAHSVTAYFAIRKEFLSASMHRIVPRIVLACAPNVPSRMEWEALKSFEDRKSVETL